MKEITTTIRLPESVHQSLRQRAFDTGVSQNSIMVEAITQYLGEGNEVTYQDTIYGDGRGNEFQAVIIPWPTVKEILGRPHEGTSEDDKDLIHAIREQGAPEWTETAEGWIDEEGWGLIGPPVE